MILERVPALSSAQHRMWFAYKMDPSSAEFTVVWAARLIGAVDTERLSAAWRSVLITHAELRLRLEEAGPEFGRAYWPVDDMPMSVRVIGPESVASALEAAVGRVFALDREPLSQLALLRVGLDEHVLVVTAHHAVMDGRSLDIVIDHLFSAYDGRATPAKGAPYLDYIEAEATKPPDAALIDRWAEELRLEDDATPLGLPLHGLSRDRSAGSVTAALSSGSWLAVRNLARNHRTTPQVVGLAAVGHTLRRYRDTQAQLVGASMDTRSARFADTVGMFVNPVPVHLSDPDSASITDLVRATHASLLRSYANRMIPFDQLVRRIGRETDASATPVFQVLFNFEPMRAVPDVDGLEIRPLDVPPRVSQYELTLTLREHGDAAELVAVYRRERHSEGDIRALLHHVREVLERIAGSDNDIADLVVSADERLQLLELGRGEQVVGDSRPIHEQVVDAARRWPSRTAITSGGRSVTYAELDRLSSALAHVLHDRGVGRGWRVGVLLPQSVDAVVAVLATLRAGGTYVPLHPDQPTEYIEAILEDARVEVLVTDKEDVADVQAIRPLDHASPGGHDVDLPEARLKDAAYIVYTSGTTGKPKGVVVEHGSLANSTAARRMVYPGTQTFLLLSPLSFDSSMAGLWSTLATGGHLVVAEADEVRDPLRLVKMVWSHEVTMLLGVPALYAAMLNAAERGSIGPPSCLSTVITAGETLPDRTVTRHFDWHPQAEFVNEYGPTETTVWSTFRRVRQGDRVNIGGPAPGAHLYVLDRRGRLMPRGAIGELYVGGDRVARGYLNRQDLTDEVFVSDPFSGEHSRMYRTGDWVRWNDAGGLDFVGRRDQLVKVRGHRVDLGAVESVTRTLDGVADVAVLVAPAGSTLEAFVVMEGDDGTEPLRAQLADLLPAPMVPSAVHRVDRLPRTSRGKVDREALAGLRSSPDDGADREEAVSGGQRDNVVAAIHAAWCEVLEVPAVAHDVNFFDAGGHSLLVPLLQAEIEDRLNISIDIVALFTATTVASQSASFGLLTSPAEAVPVADPRQARLAAAGRARRGIGAGPR